MERGHHDEAGDNQDFVKGRIDGSATPIVSETQQHKTSTPVPRFANNNLNSSIWDTGRVTQKLQTKKGLSINESPYR
jgi:hypothetical protein